MNTPILLYIFLIAVVLMAALFALNDSCKKAEELNTAILKEYRKVTDDYNKLVDGYRKLAEENKDLKARLLYERTKENADIL